MTLKHSKSSTIILNCLKIYKVDRNSKKLFKTTTIKFMNELGYKTSTY